ncbi:MAG: hypothetical protein ACX931_16710 [Saccharospirillum sp.]
MTLLSNGIDRYQAHQSLAHTDTRKTSPAAQPPGDGPSGQDREDVVTFSDRIALIEWLADQSPALSNDQSAQPAIIRQLTDNLLRYQLIGLPEAGKLLSLGHEEREQPLPPLPQALQQRALTSKSLTDKQQYQQLHRLVATLNAAQTAQAQAAA